MIIVNTKNYKTGGELLKLAKLIQFYNSDVILAVPATEVYRISSQSKLNVFIQGIDLVQDMKSTGFVSAEAARAAGASGVLLNHSEHRLNFEDLKKIVVQCKGVHLDVVICAASILEARKFLSLKPDAIAFEDPKLIGSGKSMTTYKPAEVLKFVSMLKSSGSRTKALCGAGISSAADVKAAYELGCDGVLIASAIAAEKSPRKFLLGLSEA